MSLAFFYEINEEIFYLFALSEQIFRIFAKKCENKAYGHLEKEL